MSFTWYDIWRLIKRWWWLVILAVTVAAVSSYQASKAVTPLYYTKATLMIGRAIQDPDPSQADLSLGQQLAVTYAQMARRKPVLQGAIDGLGLQIHWDALEDRVNTSIVPRTQLLEISVVDSNPPRAKALADAIAEQLVLLSPANPGGISQDEQAFARQQLDALKVKIKDAEAEAIQLKEELDAAISAREIQDLKDQSQVLEAKISDWQSTYSQLLTSLQGGEANVLMLLEEASVPTTPFSPNVRTNVLLAAAIGLGLAVGAVLFLEFVDDTLRVDDPRVESLMGMPLLGAVPNIADGRTDPRAPDAESIRQLRTKVLLSFPAQHLKTLLVTSPQPRDGKTVVTANLAVAMAGGGFHVLVVDGDLRSPSLHEWFDQPNLAGLADLLSADPELCEQLLPQLLRDTHVPGLKLMSAGHLPLDPYTLLASPNMTNLLELLSEQFDVVVFDSAPTLAAPDALILAMSTEGALLVVSPDRTSRRSTHQARDSLRSREDVNLIGVALNRTSLGRYAYKYHYGSDAQPQPIQKPGLAQRLASALAFLPVFGRPQDSDLISVERASAALGVRQNTVKRWCEEGRLPAVKQGLTWWVRQDELQRTALDRLMVISADELATPSSSQGESEAVAHSAEKPSRVGAQD